MRTISQVAELTGISTRTLQYYDEIGLLKPSGLTESGYRLYDDDALQRLQQILFFKELDFKLREIKEILQQPDFDRIAAFHRQKELLLMKRSRIDRLIGLLNRLEKGETNMSFQEFDLSDYIKALEDFKHNSTDTIIQYWGSMDNFDRFVQKVKEDESEVARLAVEHFGSVERYTEAMKYNLEHFAEIMEKQMTGDVKEIGRQSDELYRCLTSDLQRDAASDEVQQIVQKLMDFMEEHAAPNLLVQDYASVLIDSYSNEFFKVSMDARCGEGASDYIVKALRYYQKQHPLVR